MGSVRRLPRAEDDVLEIWTSIARDDAGAADRLLDRFYAKLELLADRPLMGRERPELAASLRSVSIGNYVLFYRPCPDGIELVRVRSRYLDLDPDDFEG